MKACAFGAVAVLATAASALAFQGLPPSAQVNNDPSAGINPALSVSGADPTNADVVGGALAAGKVAVPWAIFRQGTGAGGHDQAFVRSFAEGAWTTRGNGTVGGRSSSASPAFGASLNFDQSQDGEAPSIDFAGAGRTVPWASWYENTTGTGFVNNNIFASRFDNVGDANQGKWIFAGQNRGTGGGSVPVPSLNIHTNQSAENPSVAGGSTVDATKPSPWIAWQETSTATAGSISHPDQIFVERSEGPGMVNCDGVTPAGEALGGHVPAIGGFCWQQTGIERFGSPTLDPSLNVDPTRNGIEPDLAFSGAQDASPWVVWYEAGSTGTTGPNALQSNDLVFAAKAVTDAAADGGMHWQVVGSQLSGELDATGTNSFGACGANALNEAQCSLNDTAGQDAEDPRVAAGTMNSATPTVPWVAWDEGPHNGIKQVFVSRLVGAGAGAHFEVANAGGPISTGASSSTRPDISFSGNTPYVSWREDVGGGVVKAFTGHFVNVANPTFVLDGEVPVTSTAQADVREPISSSCIATPFDADGSACQGGALGTPFFLFTNGTAPLSLFADAYQPDAPVTEAASPVGSSSATLHATVNQHGTAASVSFQYGATAAYGSSTDAQTLGVGSAPTPFSAQLSGLAAATTIHYRAVASSDFGTFFGRDQTLTTTTTSTTGPPVVLLRPQAAIVGKATASKLKISGTTAKVRVSCSGPALATCRVTLKLTVTAKFQGHRLVAITAAAKARKTHKLLVIGSASVVLKSGQARVVQVGLSRAGKRLLASHHGLKATLRVTAATTTAKPASILARVVTFKPAKKPRGHAH